MTHLPNSLCWISWDPSRTAFTLPYIDHPVAWYGIIFALGFVLAYLLSQSMLKQRLTPLLPDAEIRSTVATQLIDRLTWFMVIGTIVGARLGEVFFYDWPAYRENPLDILKIWQGGLASHGGAVGVLLALAIFCWRQRPPIVLPFLAWLDLLVVPIALVACLIRIGNFFNQEILGPATELPWGIIFLHPIDGSAAVPRHPSQLYEAAVYLLTFLLLFFLWKRTGSCWKLGKLTGIFFIIVFTARFFLEFLKLPLSNVIDESFLHMGQYLSLPFIAAGVALLIRSSFTFIHKEDKIKAINGEN